jgi:hypothetical protein
VNDLRLEAAVETQDQRERKFRIGIVLQDEDGYRDALPGRRELSAIMCSAAVAGASEMSIWNATRLPAARDHILVVGDTCQHRNLLGIWIDA